MTELFQLCPPLTSDDYIYFLDSTTVPVSSACQYSGSGGRHGIPIIKQVFPQMIADGYTPLQALVLFNTHAARPVLPCHTPSYLSYIQLLQQQNDYRSWLWQSCTQMRHFVTGTSSKQPFSQLINTEYFLKIGHDVFLQKDLFPNTTMIDTLFGGNESNSSRTCITQGSLDPYSLQFIPNPIFPGDLSKQSSFQMASGVTHCASIVLSSPNDSEELIASRKTFYILTQQINEEREKEIEEK